MIIIFTYTCVGMILKAKCFGKCLNFGKFFPHVPPIGPIDLQYLPPGWATNHQQFRRFEIWSLGVILLMEEIRRSPVEVGSLSLRTFQQTPGAWAPQTPNQQFMVWNSLHLGVWGCLGYAPGVCWGSLRLLQRSFEKTREP